MNTTITLSFTASDSDISSYIYANCVPEGYEIFKGGTASVYKNNDSWVLDVIEKQKEEPSQTTYTFNLTIDYMYEYNKTESKTVTIQN